MGKNNSSNENVNSSLQCWYSRHNWTIILFIAVISFYLFKEHQEHLFGVLPWLILLACPLMHLFMHRSHGGHDHSSHQHNEEKDDV